jgi:hypothetical protein
MLKFHRLDGPTGGDGKWRRTVMSYKEDPIVLGPEVMINWGKCPHITKHQGRRDAMGQLSKKALRPNGDPKSWAGG